MEKACKRNGFTVLTSDDKKGEITATKGNKILGNKTDLSLKVIKTEKLVTKISIEVKLIGFRNKNSNPAKIEEKVVDTIYKLF